jgi:ATP:ADP antiporter, AAA family
MRRLIGVRPDDQRIVTLACATLVTIVAAHAVLETARDSLFLADLPVSRLPWAYLGVAVMAFVVVRANNRFLTAAPPRRVLAIALALGAVGTAVLWRFVVAPSTTSLMALYIWTGLLASAVVTQFWVLLGGQMDVAQAKRAYPLVAAGGMLGATIGSLLAAAALQFGGPHILLPLAAVMFACAAGLPAFVMRDAVVSAALPGATDIAPDLREIRRDPYLKRILALALFGPVIAMGIDFIFKSLVSREVPRAELGPFFARYNTLVNAAALVFQVTLAPRLLQSFGVVRNLCFLPASLGVVAAGVAGTMALPAALILRGTDGVLRHSLHRTATEILFLPLSPATRSALRGLAESIGQRGGQVLGALLIMAAIAVGASPRHLAIGVALLCGLWLFGYVRLQTHYLERFRAQLRALSTSDDVTVPALDLQSLETLVATLSSSIDGEVLAALDLLAIYQRTHLVSPLILYHPSTPVVLRALPLFDGNARDDVQLLRRRLLEHGDPAVRAAALRSIMASGGDRAVVRRVLGSDVSPSVRSTALVLWLGTGDTPADELAEVVAELVSLPDEASRLAVASTLGELPARVMSAVARGLLHDASPGVRREVARTLAVAPTPDRIELLTELLAQPDCRADARAGLLILGSPALEHLARALGAPETPAALRRHLPRTLSRFGTERAAAVLVGQLACEENDRLVDKILRGLGRLRADHPECRVDRPALIAIQERFLQRMVELLAYRVGHELMGAPDNGDLLGPLIVEEQQHALERVFRMLQILETREDFASLHAALTGYVPSARANARELLGYVLDGPFRDALLAMTDAIPGLDQLQTAAAARPFPTAAAVLAAAAQQTKAEAPTPPKGDLWSDVVEAMCGDSSVILASVARYQFRRRDPEGPTAPGGLRAAG